MSIDLSQFHQAFFEESLEGLETMETGLLNLSPSEMETEAVNTLFRVAHSIKGGSTMFGFSAIASLTHVMETLLDHVRAGRAGIDRLLVDALLAAVDCLRETVLAMKDGGGHDDRHIAASEAQLQSLLPAHARMEVLRAPVREPTEPEGKDAEIGATWRIGFRPFPHLFKTGNDPLRLLRALAGAGKLAVSADISRLPAFADLDPESCYLGWELTLDSDVGRDTIGGVSEWIEGDCDLVITTSSGGPIPLPEPVLPEVPEADHHEPVLDDPHPSGHAHGDPPRTGSERRQPVSPGAEQSSIRVSLRGARRARDPPRARLCRARQPSPHGGVRRLAPGVSLERRPAGEPASSVRGCAVRSVAQSVGPNALGVILTGMGSDGAQGLLEMREAGAGTMAQDEETSVVWGMPKEAVKLGAVDRILPLDRIAKEVMALVADRSRSK